MNEPKEIAVNTPKRIMAMESNEQAIRNQLFHRAGLCGPSAIRLVEGLWGSYLLDGLAHCQRLLDLGRRYSTLRLDRACQRAMYYGQGDYRTVKRILHRRLDQLPQSPSTDVWGRAW
jgi:hypothetical protein